jgi:hypothetical protein
MVRMHSAQLQESERLHPPIAFLLKEVVCAAKGCEGRLPFPTYAARFSVKKRKPGIVADRPVGQLA